jgi:hypothetical protein
MSIGTICFPGAPTPEPDDKSGDKSIQPQPSTSNFDGRDLVIAFLGGLFFATLIALFVVLATRNGSLKLTNFLFRLTHFGNCT